MLLVLGAAPRSGQRARSRSAVSRAELAPRASRHEPSMAAQSLIDGATPPRAHPWGACQRPMSGCAAIGLALGPNDACPELRPNPRPGGRQADPTVEHHVAGWTRSSLRSSLRRFGSGATAPIPLPPSEARADAGARFARGGRDRRQAPAPAPSPLANSAKGRPTRLPVGRAAWPTRLQATGSRPTCQEDGYPRSRLTSESRDERRATRASTDRPPGRRVGSPLLASGSATPLVQLAGGSAAPGARAERAPASAPPLAGMTPSHRFRSGAGRSEATTASYGSSRLAERWGLSCSWSWGRLHAPGNERGADRPCPVPSWHRARVAP